jgi:16S rRNA (guanine527-N7)-methyltransferase
VNLNDRITTFASLVADSPHNLVSRTARSELTTRHIPECIALARSLPAGPARLIDIGSGGGLPGLIIAMVRPDLDVHLVESTGKKASFLKEAARTLDVPITVHHGRAEELSTGSMATSFDLATARAVASLDRLLPLCIPFLVPGGLLYAVKGDRWSQELESAEPVVRRLGIQVVSTPDDRPAVAPAEPRVVVFRR